MAGVTGSAGIGPIWIKDTYNVKKQESVCVMPIPVF